ncbi:MAG: PLP-dependent aminotransferase family protein [Thermoleophilia bacterium]|nr:PLP-dependent aminotransferase family protein [Thermoleophilia bacterium]
MRVSARRMGSLLGHWAEGNGPLHERLAGGLTRVIERGELPGEALLPTERELAAELGVSRTTVVTAYGSLKRTGRLASRQGRGTWIPKASTAPRAGSSAGITSELFGSMFDEGDGAMVDLTAACPPVNPVVVEAVRSWTGAQLADGMTGLGYLPGGLPALRAAIAERYTREGLPTEPAQIVVTNGGQQAISLIASLLVRPDAAALIEDPTYPGALDILRSRGARPIPVPMDGDGILPDVLETQAVRHRPALIYVVPSFHNPTGALLAPDRAARIAELSRRTGIPVVDDQVLRHIWIRGRRPPLGLAHHDPEAPVLTVGSLSKTMWGGFRIGWVRAPRSLAERLARARLLADLGGSVPSQVMALHLMDRFDAAAEARRGIVRAAADAADAAMAELLPDWEYTPPPGGATLWVRMPWGDARAYAQAAQRAGVLVLPGSAMSATGGHQDRLRISLLGEPGELREGIRRMAAAWEAYRHTACDGGLVV